MAGQTGFAAALAIQGHHIGLQRGDRDSIAGLHIAGLLKSHPLGCKLSDDDHNAIKGRAQSDGFSWKAPSESCFDWGTRERDPVGQMLAVRMLFSALVDADFIATERHFKGLSLSGQRREAVDLDAPAAHASLLAHITQLAETSTSACETNEVRRALLETCLQAGRGPGVLHAQRAHRLRQDSGDACLGASRFALDPPEPFSSSLSSLPYLTIDGADCGVYRESGVVVSRPKTYPRGSGTS